MLSQLSFGMLMTAQNPDAKNAMHGGERANMQTFSRWVTQHIRRAYMLENLTWLQLSTFRPSWRPKHVKIEVEQSACVSFKQCHMPYAEGHVYNQRQVCFILQDRGHWCWKAL